MFGMQEKDEMNWFDCNGKSDMLYFRNIRLIVSGQTLVNCIWTDLSRVLYVHRRKILNCHSKRYLRKGQRLSNLILTTAASWDMWVSAWTFLGENVIDNLTSCNSEWHSAASPTVYLSQFKRWIKKEPFTSHGKVWAAVMLGHTVPHWPL